VKIFKRYLLVSLLSIQSVAHADDIQHISSNKENAGFGIGAIIGGLLAGPPGAIVGAAGGAWLGTRETQTDKAIASLEKELNAKSIELAFQQNELANTRAEFHNEFQRVVQNREIQSLEKLSQGISYVIYYKTNDEEIRHDVRPQIQKLAELVKSYPQIQIQIEGHADRRGSKVYNLALSKRRIDRVRSEFLKVGIPDNRLQMHAYGEHKASVIRGDQEALFFDRRVTINLTLDREA
jgi:sortase system peptidoglycan-associated protein